MNYNFTDRARKLLRMAREEAVRLRHDYIGTEHILLGLIRESEGVAAAVLLALNVDLEQVRERVEESAPKWQETVLGPDDDRPYTSEAKRALQHAMAEAEDLKHAYTSTEHLLLGLLREEKGVAAQVMNSLGVSLGLARATTRRLLGIDAGERSENEGPAFPAVDSLKQQVATLRPDESGFVVIADLDSVPASAIVELIAALDALHRAWGGPGLLIEGDHVGAVPAREIAHA